MTFRPVTTDVWPDFEALFEAPGIQAGCWWMYWRTRRADSQRQYGKGNQQAFRAVVEPGQALEILAYSTGKAVEKRGTGINR
jgi:hypothetical protein